MAKEKETKKTAKKEVKAAAPAKKTAAKEVKKTPAKKVAAKAPAKEKAVKAEKAVKTEAKTEVKQPKKAPKAKAESKEDTGSVDFQINNFSDKIKSLAKHLKTHPHDFDSRRGLLIMVGKRRRLLNYLKKSEPTKYEEAVKSLKLKA